MIFNSDTNVIVQLLESMNGGRWLIVGSFIESIFDL